MDAPSLAEVQAAVAKINNGRASDADGITAEVLTYSEGFSATLLFNLFASVWKSGRVTAEWRDGIIVSLYKGSKLDRKLGGAWARLTLRAKKGRKACFRHPYSATVEQQLPLQLSAFRVLREPSNKPTAVVFRPFPVHPPLTEYSATDGLLNI